MADYAGDLSPQEAWAFLESEPSAILVDVRTQAEWNYVGIADLAAVNRTPIFVEWQTFPEGRINDQFADQLSAQAPDQETALLFLCRSGVRSAAAATLMTSLGYGQCYNISEGFEGDPDTSRHRGTYNGWKVRGLPWIQG